MVLGLVGLTIAVDLATKLICRPNEHFRAALIPPIRTTPGSEKGAWAAAATKGPEGRIRVVSSGPPSVAGTATIDAKRVVRDQRAHRDGGGSSARVVLGGPLWVAGAAAIGAKCIVRGEGALLPGRVIFGPSQWRVGTAWSR